MIYCATKRVNPRGLTLLCHRAAFHLLNESNTSRLSLFSTSLTHHVCESRAAFLLLNLPFHLLNQPFHLPKHLSSQASIFSSRISEGRLGGRGLGSMRGGGEDVGWGAAEGRWGGSGGSDRLLNRGTTQLSIFSSRLYSVNPFNCRSRLYYFPLPRPSACSSPCTPSLVRSFNCTSHATFQRLAQPLKLHVSCDLSLSLSPPHHVLSPRQHFHLHISCDLFLSVSTTPRLAYLFSQQHVAL